MGDLANALRGIIKVKSELERARTQLIILSQRHPEHKGIADVLSEALSATVECIEIGAKEIDQRLQQPNETLIATFDRTTHDILRNLYRRVSNETTVTQHEKEMVVEPAADSYVETWTTLFSVPQRPAFAWTRVGAFEFSYFEPTDTLYWRRRFT